MNGDRKPRIVFSTPVLGHPAVGGPNLRIENSIKVLSAVSHLTLHCRVPLAQQSGLSYYRQVCEGVYLAPSASGNRYARFGKRVLRRLVREILRREILPDRQYEEADARDLVRVADAVGADVIWLGYGNISYPILKHIKQVSDYRVVVDTDSVWSRYVLRGLPYATSEEERRSVQLDGEAKRKEEVWGTRLADVTTAVSEVDADYYRELAEDPDKVHIFSNAIDVESYANPPEAATDVERPAMYLAGSFWPNSPMENAARWVVEHVLPLVRKQVPDIHFYVVGNASDQVLGDIDDPHIHVKGRLPSVLPYLCHVDAILVPLHFESGTRFKILEAGACGMPVVSTTLGAEGIPVENGRDILIADEPEAFAAAVVRLVREPSLGREMGQQLRRLVEENYAIPALTREGLRILDYLGITATSQ